jgi:AbrB family looped-hinge helix DNA binding protein
MANFTNVSAKGQFVIPLELRRNLGIRPGDTLQVARVGNLVLLKKLDLTPLAPPVKQGR